MSMEKTGDISRRSTPRPCCGGSCGSSPQTKTAGASVPSAEQRADAIDGNDLLKQATSAVTSAAGGQ